MLDLSAVQLDSTRASEGVWVDVDVYMNKRAVLTYPSPPDGVGCIRISRWNSPSHRKAQMECIDPLYALARKGNLPQDVEERETRRANAGLIMDWVNWVKGGQPFPYSKANAEAMLVDPNFVRVDELVTTVARTEEAFRLKVMEAAQGN
jgi:hypothetical protein